MSSKKKNKAVDMAHKAKLRRRWRAIVKLVMVNQEWMKEQEETMMTSNISKNITMIVRRERRTGILTMEERIILRTPAFARTIEERKKLVDLMLRLECFQILSPVIRARLAPLVKYLFIHKDRQIIKQGHEATAVYFILKGEISLSSQVKKLNSEEMEEKVMFIYGPGDIIGDIEMILNCSRMNSCNASSDVEVLIVEEDPFNEILRDYMTAQYNMKMTAIDAFPYFKYLDQTQRTHLAKISILKEFAPLETILHEDRGILGYVHFVISGTCMILQCLKMRVKRNAKTGKKTYELMKLTDINPEEEEYMSEEERLKKFREQERDVSAQANLAKMNEQIDEEIGKSSSDESGSSEEEFANLMKKLKMVDEGKYASPCGIILKPTRERRSSVRFTRFSLRATRKTLSPTGKASIHGRKTSVGNVTYENQFVNAGLFSFGGIFGLGEKFEHRAIMSQTIVQCLLIPRFWLFEKPQNPGNMWNRIRFTLNSTIPSREGLFQNFMDTQKWEKYKHWLIESVLNERRIYNPTKIQDIPLICRIVEGIDKKDNKTFGRKGNLE